MAITFQDAIPPMAATFQDAIPPTATTFPDAKPSMTTTFQDKIPPKSKTFQDVIPPTATTFLDAIPPTTTTFQKVIPPTATTFQNAIPPMATTFQDAIPPMATTFQDAIPPTTTTFLDAIPPTTKTVQDAIPPTATTFQNAILPMDTTFQNAIPPMATTFLDAIPPTTTTFQDAIPPTATTFQDAILPMDTTFQNVIPPMDTTFQDATQGRDVIYKNSYNTQSTYNYPNQRQPSSVEEANSTNNDEDNLQPRSKGYGYDHHHEHKPNYYDKAPAPPFQAKFSFDFPVNKYKSYRVFKILSMNATLDNFKSLHKPILQFGFASGMEPIYHKKSHHHHHHSNTYNEGPLKSHNYQVFHAHGPTFEYHQQNPDPIYYHQVSKPSYNKNPHPVYHHQLSNPSYNNPYQYSAPNLGEEGFGPPKPEDLKLSENYRAIDSDTLQVSASGNPPQYSIPYSGIKQNMNLDLSKEDFISYEHYAKPKDPSTDNSNEDSSSFWDFFPKFDFDSGDKPKESYDENNPFSGLTNLANLFSNIFKKKNNEKESRPFILYPFPKIPKDHFWPPLPAHQLETPLDKYWFIPTQPSKRENATKNLARELPDKVTKSWAGALPGLSKIPSTLRNEDSNHFERNSLEKQLYHQPSAFKSSQRDPLYHGINADGKLKTSHFIYDNLQTTTQNSPTSQPTTSKPWVWRNFKNENSSKRYILHRNGYKLPITQTKDKPIQDKVETTNNAKKNTSNGESNLSEMIWMVDNQPNLSGHMKDSSIQVISPPDMSITNIFEKTKVNNLTKELASKEMSKDETLTPRTDFNNKSSIIENQKNEFIQVVSSPDLTLRKFSHEKKDGSNYSREIMKEEESIEETLGEEADFTEIKDLVIDTRPTNSEVLKYTQTTTAMTPEDIRDDTPERNISVESHTTHIPQ
ncbi:uncharacterized protein [Palaemon carinicauda]|uniref:uncharacterized protein n=1 Tax=Palaemon carinicauda TaxID=392227 RepID=UPI0035B5D965